MRDRHEELRKAMLEVLNELSIEERRLFNDVLKLEQENLHMDRPRVKDEMLALVRGLIK